MAGSLRHYLDFPPLAKGRGTLLKALLDVPSAVDDEPDIQAPPVVELPAIRRTAVLAPEPEAGAVDEAATLLDEATARIMAVLARNTLLEQYVDQLESRAKVEIRNAEAAAEAWRTAAVDAEERLSNLMQSSDALAARVAVAEADLMREQGLRARLQDKIAATFGIGSELHGKLQESEIQAVMEVEISRATDRLWSDIEGDAGRHASGWHRDAA